MKDNDGQPIHDARSASSILFTLPLHHLADPQRPLVGAKAANLAALLRAGFPVPPGFCITAPAFGEFLASSPHYAELNQLLSQFSPQSAPALSTQAKALLNHSVIPPVIAQAILAAWQKHGPYLTYAVRSSATVEDSAAHSFAGQFDSVLNVQGRDPLFAAIRQCWLSLFSVPSLVYHSKNAIPLADSAMAVVVQEMVPADVAGVLFTADPLSGDSERIIIEAAPGLGNRLVSGQVNPERFTLNKKSLRVLLHSSMNSPCLSAHLARRLAKLARKAEHLFGAPQDIEWAVARGEFFLLQSRPLTTQPVKSWEDRQVWANLNTGEIFPDVTTPMTWSVVQLLFYPMFRSLFRMLGADITGASVVGLVAGRVYFNANTGLAALKRFGFLLRRLANVAEAIGGGSASEHARGVLEIPDSALPNLGFRWTHYLLSIPGLLLEILKHSPRRGDTWTQQIIRANDALAREDFSSMSTSALLQRLNAVLSEGLCGFDLLYLVTQAACLPLFQKACRDWLNDPSLALGYQLFAGLGGLPETEATLSLWRVAALAHSDPQIEALILDEHSWGEARAKLNLAEPGRRFLASWDTFMAEHGHHCRGELELFNPRWSETPDYILGLVRGYLRSIEQANPIENQRHLAEQREQLTAQCRARLKNPIQRWLFSRALRRAQKLTFNREEWKNQAVRYLTVLRRILLPLGAQLAKTGRLARPDDIFFLDVTELQKVAAGQAHDDTTALIKQRRAEYETNLTLSPPNSVIGRFDPNVHTPPTPPDGAKTLRGIPVFPGVVSGRARVILHADDDQHVLPGEILVAPFTDPAWSPYFVTAAGVIMDQGGILSHGSIVAREFGLPSVTNAGSATRLIHTGDLVQVDGTRGLVIILEHSPKR